MAETAQAAKPAYGMVIGTYEQALAEVGTSNDVIFGDAEVNWPMIKHICSASEDANASYWDADYARATWGGIISPPAGVVTWLMPLTWRPGGTAEARVMSLTVPLPGDTIINVSTQTEFLRPVRLGDVLNGVDTLTAVSEEKKTRVGIGHFITTVLTVRNQRGEIVAIRTTIALRYLAGQP
jgi:acyl dehydratase